jgi:hypothetical protein
MNCSTFGRRCRDFLLKASLKVMSGGSLRLNEYSAEMVRVACDKCGRSGQYRKQNLIDRFGADIRLPDLRWEISHCDRLGKAHDACMVRYVGLIDRHVFKSTRQEEYVQMPAKIARSSPRRSFGLPELLVATHISRPGFQGRRKIATIHAGLGVIRGMSA